MQIHIHVPQYSRLDAQMSNLEARLNVAIRGIRNLARQGETIMADLSQARADIAAAKATLVEVASDIESLVKRAGDTTDPAELAGLNAEAKSMADAVRAVADVYTAPVTDEPVDPNAPLQPVNRTRI